MRNYSKDASKLYHTQVGAGDVGRYVLMPGDPKRCKQIAENLEDARLIADSREYVTYTGTLDGVKVSVTSTGIGGPSTAIAMEELSICGADTFLRVGTCGGMQIPVKSGDLVIPTGIVRMGGTTREYAPIEYPAVPSLQVVNALADAAEFLGFRKTMFRGSGSAAEGADSRNGGEAAGDSVRKRCYHTGVVQCKDSFFGQHDPESMPVGYELIQKWEAWKKLGCLASEMESDTVYIVAAKLHARAGTCLLVVANQEREKLGMENPVVHETVGAIKVSVEAVRRLIRQDQGK